MKSEDICKTIGHNDSMFVFWPPNILNKYSFYHMALTVQVLGWAMLKIRLPK